MKARKMKHEDWMKYLELYHKFTMELYWKLIFNQPDIKEFQFMWKTVDSVNKANDHLQLYHMKEEVKSLDNELRKKNKRVSPKLQKLLRGDYDDLEYLKKGPRHLKRRKSDFQSRG